MLKRIAAHLLAVILLQQLMMAQTAHRIPFASVGNTIELTVANGSSLATSRVNVEATNVPSWLRFAQTEQILHALNAGEESAAIFSFSIDQSAPVGQEHALRFLITTPLAQQWTKEIKIIVEPPRQFELFQNYPNPFNPRTEISYQTSEPGRVTLKVYNVLGQEVATLVDADQPAGAHRVEWNAGTFASGVYVYRLSAGGDNRGQVVLQRAMMLVK
jgi:hypothetical protein